MVFRSVSATPSSYPGQELSDSRFELLTEKIVSLLSILTYHGTYPLKHFVRNAQIRLYILAIVKLMQLQRRKIY